MEIREEKYSCFPCFFCKRDGSGSRKSNLKLSLCKILNYLQLFAVNGKQKKLNYPSDEKLDMPISICSHCSELTTEFSELYHLLEVTELRLSRCLEQMMEVMTKAEHYHYPPDKQEEDQDDTLRITMIGRIKELSELPHVGLRSRSQIVPNFTSIILDEYSSIEKDLKGQTPTSKEELDEKLNSEDKIERNSKKRRRVSSPSKIQSETWCQVKRKKKDKKKGMTTRTTLETHSDDTAAATVAVSSSSSSSTSISSKKHICKFCKKSFDRLYHVQRHMKLHCKEGKGRTPPPSSPRHPPDNESLLTCAYCNYECASRPYHMNRHLIRHHPEMFFQTERESSSLSRWKHKHFKRIVKEILIPKFILRNGMYTSCSVCGKKSRSKRGLAGNSFGSTIHLTSNHIPVLREHLKDIMEQSDASLQEEFHVRNQETK